MARAPKFADADASNLLVTVNLSFIEGPREFASNVIADVIRLLPRLF